MPDQEKFAKVMREFEKGKLKSSSGAVVTSRKQAEAIAASEAGYDEEEAAKNEKSESIGRTSEIIRT